LPPAAETTIVIGMLGDKKLAAFARELGGPGVRWVTCTVDDPRARRSESLATELRELGHAEVFEAPSPTDALATARATATPGSRIVVCGSFRVVGPALQVLGLY
jgi:folylpolyglutamate synthase/dihydropteroate synthase